MSQNTYGISKQHTVADETDRKLEELAILGYTVIENVISEKKLDSIRKKLDTVYRDQVKEFGEKKLENIGESFLARCLLAYDRYFLQLASEKTVISILKKILGDYFVLHLQNGILNMPGRKHHQTAWHRDLPYQDFVISKPLALSVLHCIDDFTEVSGATVVIPYSHKLEVMPSGYYIKKHSVQIEAKAGSLILFDSMLFHRAGNNRSGKIRRGINHVYTSGILRQQINIPSMISVDEVRNPFMRMLLGFDNETPDSVMKWREKRAGRKNK